MAKKRFMLGQGTKLILFLSLLEMIILWVGFYFITISVFKAGVEKQVKVISNVIISEVEDRISFFHDETKSLANNKEINNAVGCSNPDKFYSSCANVDKFINTLAFEKTAIESAVIFNPKGLSYRLIGDIPDFNLGSIYEQITSMDSHYIIVEMKGHLYLGICETIENINGTKGYLVTFMNQSNIERIFDNYKDISNFGVIMLNDDSVFATNKYKGYNDIKQIKRHAKFIDEKEIADTGCTFFAYSDSVLPDGMSLFFGVSLVITIMIFAMIIISFASRMSRDYVRMQVKDLQIKKEENYLFLLKKQINAHFTVNTLSAVRTLIKKGELEEAGEISDGLSFLLRYANAGEENIDLMEELFTLDRYAGIMKIRYPGKFKLLIEPDEECENVCIPRMLLQPILENAIVHGLASNNGTIRILASAGEDTVIKIMDTGCGIEKEALKELNLKLANAASDDEIDDGIEEHGKALINIQKRIYMLFGEGYGVTVESVVDEWTTVTVTLPSIPNE